MPKIQLMSDVGSNIGLVLDAECLRCEVVEELNGEYTLEMDYPVDGEYFSEITYRKLIYCKPSPYADADYFRIYEIRPSMGGGRVTVLANHISYDLAGIVTAPFTATSAADAFAAMKNGAVTSCPFTFQTDVVTQSTMTTKIPSNIRRLQGGVEGSIIDTFGGEYEYEGLTVKLLSRRGADRGSEIRYGKNLLSLEQEKNCASVYTAILPYWYTEEEGLVQGSLVQVVGTFDFVRVLSLDVTDKFDSKPTVAQVENAGQAYAVNNKVGIPKVSFTVDFVLLETTQEYADAISLADRVFLGDTVSVYFPKFGVNASARVIRTRYNVLTGNFIGVDIGEAKSLITDTITAQNNALTGIKDGVIRALPSAVAAAVQRATENITGAIKGYIHYVYDANGNPIELMILDNINPANAVKVWRWNMGGLGYSSTGVNGPFTTAITANGEIVADFITAGTLDADLINVINLIADHVKATDGTRIMDISAATLKANNGTNWRTWIHTDTNDQGVLFVYGGTRPNLNGDATDAGNDSTSYMSYLDPHTVAVGLSKTNTPTGEVLAGLVEAYGNHLARMGGGFFGYDTSSVMRVAVRGQNGNIQSYDSAGRERVGLYPAEGQISLYNSSGTRNVQIRGDGTASSNPLPINQGGTGATSASNARSGLGAAGRTRWTGSGTSLSISLSDGEMAMLTFVAGGSIGNVDVVLTVNGASASQASYSYAGTSNNYTSKIFARASNGTFVGWIACHNGVTEVWGCGRRGTDNVRGDVLLVYSQSSVSTLATNYTGSWTVTKITA